MTKKLDFPTSIYEEIEADVLAQEYGDMNFEEIVPVNIVDQHVASLGRLTVDYSGKAGQVTGKYGEKLNLIDFKSRKDDVRVFDLGFGVPIDLEDIRSAVYGRSIDAIQTKMEAAMFVHRKSIYDIALTGGDVEGLTGIINAPEGSAEGQISVIQAVGSGATQKWTNEAKTAELIRDDMIAGYNATLTQTDNARPADTVFMPLTAFTTANSKYLANSAQSAIQAFREAVRQTTGQEINIRTNNAFKTDMLFYQNNRDVLRLNLAQDITFYEEQWNGLGYLIPVHYRNSGVDIRNPHALVKVKNIL